MAIIKPQKLKKGDTIAIISPAWGGPSEFPHIYQSGIKILQKLGFKIKEFPSAKKDDNYLYYHPEFRAKDVNNAFKDKKIKAIFTSIGGDDSIRILPLLDLKIIRKNPKIIIGYSDITTLLTYLNQKGLVTLHGPTVMAGFSQWDSFEKLFKDHINAIFFENPKNYAYKPFESYCDGYLDWSNKSNVGKTNHMKSNLGWTWLQGDSIVEGKLFGGCVEVMEFMKSTKYWPNKKFWKGKILFLETSEHKPLPNQVKYILRNYGMQGVFDRISALIIGRPRDYSKKEKIELDKVILEVIKNEFNNDSMPIITNMDFGHTDPQWILPLGINAEIDCRKKSFRLKENIFED